MLALHQVSSLWQAVPALAQPMGCLALKAMAGVTTTSDDNRSWLDERMDAPGFFTHTLLAAATNPTPEPASAPAVLGAAWLLASDRAWPTRTTAYGAVCMAAALVAARRCQGYKEQATLMPTALNWLVGTQVPPCPQLLSTLLRAVPTQLPPRYALLRAGLRWLLSRPTDASSTREAFTAAVKTLGDASALPDERTLASAIVLQLRALATRHTWAADGCNEAASSTLDSAVAAVIVESFASTASRDRRNAAGEPVSTSASSSGGMMQRILSGKIMGLDNVLLPMVKYPFEQLAWPAGLPVPGVTQGWFTPLHAHIVAALVDGGCGGVFEGPVKDALAKDTPASVHAAAEIVAGVLSRSERTEWALDALADGVRSNEHGEAWAAAARFVVATSTDATVLARLVTDDSGHTSDSTIHPTWALQRRLCLLEGLLCERAHAPALQGAAIDVLQRVSANHMSAGVRAPFAALLVRLCGVTTAGMISDIDDAELDAVVVAPPTANTLLAASLDDVPTMCAIAEALGKHATAAVRRRIVLHVIKRLLALQEATAEGSVGQMEARAALVTARYVPFFSVREANAALDAIRAVVEDVGTGLWAPRAAAVVFLQTLAFRCAPLLEQQDVLEVGRTALRDARTDVRDVACTTLSGVLAMAGGPSTRAWLLGGDASDELGLQGVLARRALVAAWPYDVPPWMPSVLLALSRAATAARDRNAREAATSALRESARTHEEQQRMAVRAAVGEDVFAVDGGGYFV